jgi:DNA mismatch repair protein MutS2
VKRRKITGSKPFTLSTSPRGYLHRPLSVGEKVVLRTLGNEGTILSIDDDYAEIQAGSLRLRVRFEELKRKNETVEEGSGTGKSCGKMETRSTINEPGSHVTSPSSLHAASPGIELDLRGQRAEDAVEMLDRYLEKACLAGLPFVRIIHGKGTGKLRQEVRAMLKDHPQVSSFEEGGPKEGGEGVTVAKMIS